MATDDCFEIGREPCPCGAGIIAVEMCVPDHPWAKAGQASYTPALVCDACGEKYAFFEADIRTRKSRLVLRSDLQEHNDAKANWHRTLRQIEACPEFKDLAKRIDMRLAGEKSMAARHRVLSAANLGHGMSLGQYRKRGYHLSALEVANAMALLRVNDPKLAEMAKQAETFAATMHRAVPAVKTGITGLEI